MLYQAMAASLDDVFYAKAGSGDWRIYNQISRTHSAIETEARLLKVYKEL